MRRTRRELFALGGAGLAAWTAPQILDTRRASAAAFFSIQINPSTCGAEVSTSPSVVGGCAPAGFSPGVFPPAGLGFTVAPFGADCSNGMVLTVTAPTCNVVSGVAEQQCTGGSGGTVASCVSGAVDANNNAIIFPDNSAGPGTCLYLAFRVVVNCFGSII